MSDLNQVPPGGDGPNWKIPVLFGGVIALLGANIYLFMQLDAVRNEAGELTFSCSGYMTLKPTQESMDSYPRGLRDLP